MCWQCDHPGSTTEDYLDELHSKVLKNGWAVQYIESDRRPFAYTVGLTQRGLPELLVTGVVPRRAVRMLNSAAQQALEVGTPSPGMRFTLSIGRHVELVEINHPDVHLKFAVALYGPLRALQLVWADERDRWPWSADFDDGRGTQPVLGMRAEGENRRRGG
ncbi:DUF4262 domain-containing protein [Mycobacterium sp.]|uniref:DUF4262 domain-containing protein n=1 Tax=Mycobacterium sp. TaxID=1785 RepID=UPI002BFEEFD3|nr:DUF4262 domain-containing protein [Mycobacterium sp.]HTQ17285.1 DUF4262 domain-containing protein [Mycobacterium sp.]